MDTSQKVEFTALICHIEKFSKSGIPIHKSEARTWLAEKEQEVGQGLGVCILNVQIVQQKITRLKGQVTLWKEASRCI